MWYLVNLLDKSGAGQEKITKKIAPGGTGTVFGNKQTYWKKFTKIEKTSLMCMWKKLLKSS